MSVAAATAKTPSTKIMLSASAQSFVPSKKPMKLKQVKLKKKKPKPIKQTYEEKVDEYNEYLWQHHGKYRQAVNAVFDSDSSADYSGHCSFAGEDSFHSVIHGEGDTLHDFVPKTHKDPALNIGRMRLDPDSPTFLPSTPRQPPQQSPPSTPR